MTKRIDLNTEREVIRLYTTKTNNGWMGCNSISDIVGISTASVQNILLRNGIKTRDAVEAHLGKQCKPITNIPVGNAPLCKCGCGNLVAWNQRKDKWNVFVDGHYRKDALYKNPMWLKSEYEGGKTFTQIAKQFGVLSGAVGHFAKQFGIAIRSHSETLKMLGNMKGSNNPSWKGGGTPARQSLQKTDEWIKLVKFIYKRDGYKCRRCNLGHDGGRKFHAHHIKSFTTYPDLRLDENNLITLCDICHRWVHSRQNVNHDFIVF